MKTNTKIALPNQKQTASPKARDCKCIHASPKTTIKPCTAQRINKNKTDGPQIRKQTNPLSIPAPAHRMMSKLATKTRQKATGQ